MTSVNYAYTITLKPQLYKQTPDKQYDATAEYVRDRLFTISSQLTLVAELTKSVNVHFHGVINFKLDNVCKKRYDLKFANLFRNDPLIGFTNLRQIDNEIIWSNYISKSVEDTHLVLMRRPIIIDNFEIFNESQRANHALSW